MFPGFGRLQACYHSCCLHHEPYVCFTGSQWLGHFVGMGYQNFSTALQTSHTIPTTRWVCFQQSQGVSRLLPDNGLEHLRLLLWYRCVLKCDLGCMQVNGIMREGMLFTIEPMINAGSWKDITWPDEWTAVTKDGQRSAQFEHTLLVTADGCEALTKRLATSPPLWWEAQ